MPPETIFEDTIITSELVDTTLDDMWNGRDKMRTIANELNLLQNTDDVIVIFDEDT